MAEIMATELFGQVPQCNIYFTALLMFLVEQFSSMFQFSNCNILGRYPIDSAISRSAPDMQYTAIVIDIGHHVSLRPR